MRKIILALATAATLLVGSFAVPNTAEARPYRYWGGYGGPYYGGYYRPYYRPYGYSYYYGPRYYNYGYYGYPGYRYASPGLYLGVPGAGVYIR